MWVAPADGGLRNAANLATEAWCALSAGTKLVLRRAQAQAVRSTRPPDLRAGTLARPPVLLVHGLGADRSCFSTMEARLRDAGYTVHSFNYSCVGKDVETCARTLEREAAWLLEATGWDALHVVAHSLGGVVLRWAAAHTELGRWLTLGITLGSPHQGTPTARLAPSGLPAFGTIISQLRPGGPGAVPSLTSGPGAARWVAVGGRNDWLVPPRYAALPPLGNVRNEVVAGAGHMGLTRHPEAVALVLAELAAAGATTRLPTPLPGSGRRVSGAVRGSSLSA